MFTYMLIYVRIYIFVMTQWNHRICSRIIQKLKRLKQCDTFHSCLGVMKSLEQYRAALNQDTSTSAALPPLELLMGPTARHHIQRHMTFHKLKLTPNQLPNLTKRQVDSQSTYKHKQVDLVISCFLDLGADPV